MACQVWRGVVDDALMPIATLRYTLPDEQAEYDAARLGALPHPLQKRSFRG